MPGDNFNKPDTMFTGNLSEESIRIKIIGVGGAGTNAIDRLKLSDLSEVHLASVNTDMQALANSLVSEKVMIGRGVTRGMGTGGEINLGKEAAEADRAALEKLVRGCDLVFIVSGLGGGTGSGAAPLLAELAAAQGALTIAFTMLPFTFEGGRRKKVADDAMGALRKSCDAVIPLPNDVLLQTEGDEATVLDAFGMADEWIRRAIKSICTMLLKTGLINQDFSSLKQVFVERGGKTVFSLGYAEGEGAVEKALDDLLLCPLLHIQEYSKKADNLIVQITGGTDLTMGKVNQIMATISEKLGCRDNIVMGATIDESRTHSVEIVVIGTTLLSRKTGYDKPPAAAVSQNASGHEPAGLEELGEEAKSLSRPKPEKEDFTKSRYEVHESKLKKKKQQQQASLFDQNEFEFLSQEEQRGFFDNTERNLYDGEDLDVPTYLRQGVKINLKD
jgi:cell division protein FtsZ